MKLSNLTVDLHEIQVVLNQIWMTMQRNSDLADLERRTLENINRELTSGIY